MSLRDEKKQATAARIRQAARELFLARGVDSVSVEDIAAAAGISRASLFNYYRGKSAILDGLGDDLEQRLLQLVQHYLAKPLATAQRLQLLFAYTARNLEQTGDLVRLVFVQGSEGAGFPRVQESLVELVALGQSRADVRRDIAAEDLAELVYLSFVAGLLGWCRQPGLALESQLRARADSLALLLANPPA